MGAYAAAATAQPTMGIVVFTGVSLVFLILVFIMLLIKAQGVLFEKIEQRTKKKQPQPPKPESEPVQPPVSPVAEEGIPTEVVAVIAAAVAAMEGGYRICEIKKHEPSPPVSQPTNAWAQAGRAALTTPFRR